MTYTMCWSCFPLAIPVLAAERDETQPLVIAGGTCVLNPEPIADFFDFFVIGDGEKRCWNYCRQSGNGKLKNYRNSSYCAKSRSLPVCMFRAFTKWNINLMDA